MWRLWVPDPGNQNLGISPSCLCSDAQGFLHPRPVGAATAVPNCRFSQQRGWVSPWHARAHTHTHVYTCTTPQEPCLYQQHSLKCKYRDPGPVAPLWLFRIAFHWWKQTCSHSLGSHVRSHSQILQISAQALRPCLHPGPLIQPPIQNVSLSRCKSSPTCLLIQTEVY